jgi:hypothetical protein
MLESRGEGTPPSPLGRGLGVRGNWRRASGVSRLVLDDGNIHVDQHDRRAALVLVKAAARSEV